MNRINSIKAHPALLAGLLAAAIAAMFVLKQCSTPLPFRSGESSHSGGDTVDIAIEYAPMSLYMTDDTLGGYAYDILRRISSDSIVMKFHPVVSHVKAREGLAAGIYDMVVADMPMTADNDSTIFSYTPPVYLDRQILVQRRDTADGGSPTVKSALDLAGKHVTVTADSPMHRRLINLSAEIGDTIYIDADSVHGSEQLFLLVAVGEKPYAVVNEKLARALAPDYPEIDLSARISFTQFQAWLLRRDNEPFNSRISAAIERYRSEAGE